MIIRDLDRDMGRHATAIRRMKPDALCHKRARAQGDGPVREATSKQKEWRKDGFHTLQAIVHDSWVGRLEDACTGSKRPVSWDVLASASLPTLALSITIQGCHRVVGQQVRQYFTLPEVL